jgi:hypothetical protein
MTSDDHYNAGVDALARAFHWPADTPGYGDCLAAIAGHATACGLGLEAFLKDRYFQEGCWTKRGLFFLKEFDLKEHQE